MCRKQEFKVLGNSKVYLEEEPTFGCVTEGINVLKVCSNRDSKLFNLRTTDQKKYGRNMGVTTLRTEIEKGETELSPKRCIG
jgi:hypothetical protein